MAFMKGPKPRQRYIFVFVCCHFDLFLSSLLSNILATPRVKPADPVYSALLVCLHHYASQLVLSYDRSQLQLSIQLERCSCTRHLSSWDTSYSTNYSDTTCGRDAFLRGHGQKVVAFSFYGNSSSPNHLLRGFFQGRYLDVFFLKSI